MYPYVQHTSTCRQPYVQSLGTIHLHTHTPILYTHKDNKLTECDKECDAKCLVLVIIKQAPLSFVLSRSFDPPGEPRYLSSHLPGAKEPKETNN